MIFNLFGYTVNVFKSKPNKEFVNKDLMYKIVSDGHYLRLQHPNGDLINREIACSITVENHCTEPAKAVVEMFVDITPITQTP